MVILQDFIIQIRVIFLIVFYHRSKNDASLILLITLRLTLLNCLKSEGLTLLNSAICVTISHVRYDLDVLVLEKISDIMINSFSMCGKVCNTFCNHLVTC